MPEQELAAGDIVQENGRVGEENQAESLSPALEIDDTPTVMGVDPEPLPFEDRAETESTEQKNVDGENGIVSPKLEEQPLQTPETSQEDDGPQDMLVERWFGQRGFFYNLIKDKTEFTQQAIDEVDAEFEGKALEAYEAFSGQAAPADKASTVIEEYKKHHQADYDAKVQAKKEGAILKKIDQIKSGSLELAVKEVIDDPEIQEQTIMVIREMLKDRLGEIAPELSDTDTDSEGTGEVGEMKREKSDKEKFKDILKNVGANIVNESNFAELVTALLGSYSSGLESYRGKNGKFREDEIDIEEFGIDRFTEKARELSGQIGSSAEQGSAEQLKYGFNTMVVKLVQQADENDGFRELMSQNGVNLKSKNFSGILDENLSNEALAKELPEDGVLQKRILGLYEMVLTLVKAGKTSQVDALFKETLKQAGLQPNDKLGITEELVLYFKVVGGSAQGFKAAFE